MGGFRFRLFTAALMLAPAPLAAGDPAPVVETLFQGDRTVIGQPLAYPPGEAVVTAQIITLPPGAATGWHLHAVPLYAYILEGELTVAYRDQGTRIYRAGDSLLEAIDWPHNGHNGGAVPVRILAVYLGALGLDDATKVPDD